MEAYIRALGLSGQGTYDAQGNAFDRALLGVTIGPALAEIAHGRPPPTHLFPSLADIRAVGEEACAMARSAGLPAHPAPYPH
eukprot:4216099-Prorocentrum_lima.AAC.1